MRRAVAALAAGLCLASAACTAEPGADPPTATPTATAPPTTTSSTTPTSSAPATSTPGDLKAPVMPAQARVNSRAGARAFIRYYLAALNYGYLAGDSRAVARVAARDCAVCGAFANNIERIQRRGGGQTGGIWSVARLDPIASGPQSDEIFIGRVQIAEGTTRATRHAAMRPIHAESKYFEFHVSWSGSAWQAEDLRPG